MTRQQPLSLLSLRSQTRPCMLPPDQEMLTRYNALLSPLLRATASHKLLHSLLTC